MLTMMLIAAVLTTYAIFRFTELENEGAPVRSERSRQR
jgi:hypothetical protein